MKFIMTVEQLPEELKCIQYIVRQEMAGVSFNFWYVWSAHTDAYTRTHAYTHTEVFRSTQSEIKSKTQSGQLRKTQNTWPLQEWSTPLWHVTSESDMRLQWHVVRIYPWIDKPPISQRYRIGNSLLFWWRGRGRLKKKGKKKRIKYIKEREGERETERKRQRERELQCYHKF